MLDSVTDPPETVDDHLNLLAHEQCRATISYFSRHSTATAPVDDLAEFVRDRTDRGAEPTGIEIRLHHVTLPRLAEAGVIEYDARSNTARYRGHPALETWADRLVEDGGSPE